MFFSRFFLTADETNTNKNKIKNKVLHFKINQYLAREWIIEVTVALISHTEFGIY